MIGERQIVEILLVVVGVERAPAAAPALHPLDPFAATSDRFDIARAIVAGGTVHRHHHDRGVVGVGIEIVGILKRPAAGPEPRALVGPIADDIEHLARAQPVEGAGGAPDRVVAADLEHGVRGERGVPDRRHARLAIDAVGGGHDQLFERFARRRTGRVVGRKSERIEHHHGIGHRGVDRAQPILAVEPLDHPVTALLDRAAAEALGP